ncbi:MAG: hypothetical protein ACIAS6_15535 [Phycisphaerales bacterium JB060]
MLNHKTLVVLTAAGLAAPVVTAEPAGLPSTDDHLRPTDQLGFVHDYIATLAGPSNFAPFTGGVAEATAPPSGGLGASTLFMVAGPDHRADRNPRLSIPAGGFGDGPGDVLGELARAIPPVAGPSPMADRGTSTEGAPGGGTFEVAVPLPGAGALAAGGLLFVAVRRRR